MKAFVTSMLSIAATIAAMTACTSESDPINGLDGNEKVEIKVEAGVGSIITKAAVGAIGDAGLDVFFCKAPDGETVTWTTAAPLYAKIAKEGGISFYSDATHTTESKQYYNTDKVKSSWLSGCYLGGAQIAAAKTTLTNNKVSFTITGQEDILATNGLSGTKETNFEEFTFNHLLSNLSFVVVPKKESELATITEAFGKVTKIEVLEQPNFLDLTLGDAPSLAPNTTPGSVTFALSKEVTIATNAAFGDIMIYPTSNLGKTGKEEIKIKVYTEKASNGIDVNVQIGDGNTGIVAKTKYVVTLSFSATDITATAKIGEWAEGTGSGDVK